MGLGLIAGRVKQTFWGIILFTTMILLGYNGVLLFIEYFSYKVNVTVEVKHEYSIEFPAVTVCNMNPLKRSAVKKHDDLSAVLDGKTPSTAHKRKKRIALRMYIPLIFAVS